MKGKILVISVRLAVAALASPRTMPEAYRPPADAVVLFDGTQGSLDANWTDMKGRKAKWRCVDGTIEATRAAGDIRTRREFGDVQLHIEWQVPANLPPYDMNSGNSGVFLMGLYELQVFESYETDPADMKHPFYADGQAAAIYGQNPPLVNPTRRRGEWQTYDIVFRRPVFNGATCVRPAVITAFLNGVLVQDGWKLEGPTGHLRRTRQVKPPSDKGPIKLQQHLCPVRFRNVWVRELSITPRHSQVEMKGNWHPELQRAGKDQAREGPPRREAEREVRKGLRRIRAPQQHPVHRTGRRMVRSRTHGRPV